MKEMKLEDLKLKSPTELLSFAEEVGVENASTMRKQELMFAILKQLAAQGDRDHRHRRRRGAAGRLRLPALAGCQLSARSRRHLRLALADPPLRAAHRRHGRGPDPQPQGGRALLRAAQGQHDQFRGPGEDTHKVHFDNLTPLYPDEVAEDGDRGSDHQGPVGRASSTSCRRSARASARLIVAPPRTGKTVLLQNIAHVDRRQPSRVLPDRAADRRAARGSHRHAALREGRGHLLDLRRAGLAPRAGRRDGDREGQAPGRAQARRGDPARIRSRASAAPTTPSCRPPARC